VQRVLNFALDEAVLRFTESESLLAHRLLRNLPHVVEILAG
jgi:hypothetical protein